MKRTVWFVLLIAATLCWACGGGTPPEPAGQEESPEAEPAAESDRGNVEATIGEATITIDYGRPALDASGNVNDTGLSPKASRDRAAAGYVWRLGMNEATTVETSAPLKVGETTLPAGKYTIFAKKGEGGDWELIFNSALGLWGAFDYDATKDLASTPLEISENPESVDRFTIEAASTGEDSVQLVLRWGTDQLTARFSAKG